MRKIRRGSEDRKKRKRVRANKFCEKGNRRYEVSRKKKRRTEKIRESGTGSGERESKAGKRVRTNKFWKRIKREK